MTQAALQDPELCRSSEGETANQQRLLSKLFHQLERRVSARD
jgi:hypothetical protein